MAKSTIDARGLIGCDGKMRLVDLELSPPAVGEVTVRLLASGLCHTDLYVRGLPRPHVLGHEGAGVVTDVGSGVDLELGQRVVLNWAMPCGACFQCASGGQHLCERRSPLLASAAWDGPRPPRLGDDHVPRAFGLGTLATHTVVPASAVWPIGEDVSPAAAAIVGCGVMTGAGSVFNVAKVQPGDSAVVIGCGGVGLSVIQALRIAGATTVIAVDRLASRCDLALRFGATDTLTPAAGDDDLIATARRVRSMTAERGADCAFECTGVARLGSTPLRMIRHGGMAVQISGFDATVPIDLSLFMFDKIYVNPLYGQCAPARDLPRLFGLYRAGRLLLDEMVTRTYELDEYEQAFDDLEHGRNAKGVVIFR